MISIITPCHNENGNIQPLLAEITEVLADEEIEFIIVDDGSTDGTLETVKLLRAGDDRIHFVSLTRNFGHQAALRAGLLYASGSSCAIMLDADLQHPPSVIPEMLAKWRDGAMIVYTVRNDERTPPLKRFMSNQFYRAARWLSDVNITSGSADFRLIDRSVITALQEFREQTLFLRGVLPWLGFDSAAVSYDPGARRSGETKYTLRRMMSLALTGMVSLSLRPLRLALIFASIIAALTVIYGVYTLIIFATTDNVIPGWTSVILVVSALGAVNLLVLGVIGEYLGRVLREAQGRPTFVVRETSIQNRPKNLGTR